MREGPCCFVLWPLSPAERCVKKIIKINKVCAAVFPPPLFPVKFESHQTHTQNLSALSWKFMQCVYSVSGHNTNNSREWKLVMCTCGTSRGARLAHTKSVKVLAMLSHSLCLPWSFRLSFVIVQHTTHTHSDLLFQVSYWRVARWGRRRRRR